MRTPICSLLLETEIERGREGERGNEGERERGEKGEKEREGGGG